MKKLILSIFTVCLILTNVSGQETSNHFSKKNAVKLNPIRVATSEFQIVYERYLNDRNTSFIIAPSIILRETNDEVVEGWQMMAQYRFYLTHLRKDQRHNFLNVYNYGFYAGLYGLYLDYNEKYTRWFWDYNTNENISAEFKKDVQSYEGGALLGIQIDITKRILVDFYIGGGIRKSERTDTYIVFEPDYNSSYGIFNPSYTGVKPKIGLMIGITF